MAEEFLARHSPRKPAFIQQENAVADLDVAMNIVCVPAHYLKLCSSLPTTPKRKEKYTVFRNDEELNGISADVSDGPWPRHLSRLMMVFFRRLLSLPDNDPELARYYK
ncbi:hypothetical protein BFW01_g1668 [Lasiodiplodia theobromae]|uniref:SEP4 MADS-box protein n=1 Tax=Lasiodiplodia theobromae TaxID=45133 RepID=UPI0015C2EB96|nr:SEP4 MADS-box protein [Lasiodiplodia theobromae]KAF4537821.1 SEP4 MADS-box protein [Lasiodiplodia theobromae]KAF9641685.1 hypothetical protein BFW01_g1668 [Lasiodiplodia theobromae]